MLISEIPIRDPFVLPKKEDNEYWLYGSTDKNIWSGTCTGFDCYRSRDLADWTGPFPAFRPPEGFWATTEFWAPEVHCWSGRYYMFATFKEPGSYRGTQILVSDRPDGPFVPLTAGPVTPPDCECLDGTFYVDGSGKPWIVYCHEWTQIHNGAIYAMPLSEDLTRAAGRQELLFHASEAPWVKPLGQGKEGEARSFPNYVTDGPYLFRSTTERLLLLWSSFSDGGYSIGQARSVSGDIHGPWVHEPDMLWNKNGGHGMIFRTFDGRTMLAIHSPNTPPHERAVFIELQDKGEGLFLGPCPKL